MGRIDETWAVVYPPLQELKAEPDRPWEERRSVFLDKLGLSEPSQDPVVEAFLQHVEDLPEDQRDDLLRTEEADTLMYGLIEEHTQPEPDESTWTDHLTRCGPYWDGTEESWDQFREWFAYEAEQAGVGEHAEELLAQLETQDIEDRIVTFGRNKVTIIRREVTHQPDEKKQQVRGKRDTTDEQEEETEPRRSKRLKTKADAKPKRTGPPRLTVRTQQEGPNNQRLNTRQNIGFHMVVTLTNPPGNVTAYELRQYARDEFTKRSGAQPMTGYTEDVPFAPPYQDDDEETDVNITITDDTITFDDHPGFSTTSAIAVNDWLSSYTVEFYWTVTRTGDGAVWTSPNTVSHEVDCPYTDGSNQPITYTPGDDEDWVVTFPDDDEEEEDND